MRIGVSNENGVLSIEGLQARIIRQCALLNAQHSTSGRSSHV